MFKRPLFWLGLLLGAFAAFRLPKRCSQPSASADLSDLILDAFIVCNRTGAVTETNAAALALFGSSRLPALRYPTEQPVPPGQHPLRRAFQCREVVSGGYHLTAADGSERVLDVTTRPLPDGGAAAVFRDVTAQQESEARAQAAQARQAVLQTLCRRLSRAQTAEAMGQAVAEETHALLNPLPDLHVRLYRYDPLAQTLTRLAAAGDRPRPPRSAAQLQALTARFDAQVPALWQMYVARQPSKESLPLLQDAAASVHSLPLIACGTANGHLTALSSSANAFEDTARQEMLETVASVAALALAGPQASAQAAALTAQAAAVHEITQAVSRGMEQGALAALAMSSVKRITQAEVCTLSVPNGAKLCVIGQAWTDDLLRPQTAPDDLRLHPKAVQKAWRTQKIAAQNGLANPSLEAGLWRAFAGSAGGHSVTALPLARKRGVLTVYTSGAVPLPEPQIKFLETLAALVSLSLAPASATAAPAD